MESPGNKCARSAGIECKEAEAGSLFAELEKEQGAGVGGRGQVQNGLRSPRRVLFFKDYFLCGPLKKIFIEFITILPALCFVLFGHEPCGILVSYQDQTTPPALEGKVLLSGPPGKFPHRGT